MRKLWTQESGQGMVEYGLIVGLIAVIALAVFVGLGPSIKNMFFMKMNENAVGEGQAEISSALY